MTAPTTDWQLLKTRAKEAATRAYAPYSNYHVGCALLGTDGVIYTGCNVENATYGATSCAERSAIGRAVTDGCQTFVACAIYTQGDDQPGAPCGICRQVLAEFSPTLHIVLFNDGTQVLETTLDQLLPHMFTKDFLS